MKKTTAAALLLAAATLAAATTACSKDGEESSPASSSATTSSAATSTTSSAAPTTEASAVNKGAAPGGVGSFTMDGPAAITGATYDSMPYELPLNPAGPQDTMVRWVTGWGQSPTTPEKGTTYVLGHAWGQQKLVFNPISELVTATADMNAPVTVLGDEGVTVRRFNSTALNGSKITMSDGTGAREWVVDTAYLVDKDEAAYDTQLVDETIPGRIVLIACSVDGSQDLDYNVIVEGHLD